MPEKLKYWVWLNTVPGIGARKGMQLLEKFEDPENIWNASELELRRLPFLTGSNVKQLVDGTHRDNLEEILRKIRECNVQVITLRDVLYPYYLKNTYDPPIVLYVRGKFIKEERMIAVVGSRYASAYGLSMADRLSFELAKAGITVISGMARGVDSYAHCGALKGKGRTIAVLGCGPDIPYPPENKSLMNKIIDSGAVISEFAPGMPPIPMNFPARNRIISGMSLGVVVVEAGEKSGSLITANFALEQGRDVFAIPGNINSMNSRGTNKLIKDGAKIVTSVEDILEELSIFHTEGFLPVSDFVQEQNPRPLFKGLDRDEIRVAELLLEEPMHIDQVANKSGMSVQRVSSILIMLELNGVVEQLPGKRFKLKD